MKYLSAFAIIFFLACRLQAQPIMKLAATEHDFGVFKEEDGKQSYTFRVTNSGNQPLVIQNIVASCGCTTPDWTKSPIAPGASGEIKAVYDPANRPGPFSKTLTVFSNSAPSPVVLHLKGEVKGFARPEADYYPWQVGQLKLKGNSIAFPLVLKTEKRIRILQVINTGRSKVNIGFAEVPPYIELKAIPRVLDPGGKGIIECIYYGNRTTGWGNITDKVKLKLDGTVHPEELFILAIVNEDFSKLSKSELSNAPVFRPENLKYDLGKVDKEGIREFDVKLKNDGHRDLIIRSVWSSCLCLKAADGLVTVKPGEEGTVKMSFDPEKVSGKTLRSFYIYTNDPSNSKVSFSFQADVAKKK